MKQEIWVPVLGNDAYKASNQGNIMSLNYRRTGKEHIMKQYCNSNGYCEIDLRKHGIISKALVSHLVWEAFNGPIPEGMQVNHINEDKTDNRLENLNLMAPSENINWGTRNERAGKSISKTLTRALGKMVEQYTLDGTHICTWFSTRAVEKELGYHQSNISACCRGVSKTAYGYIWKYAE